MRFSSVRYFRRSSWILSSGDAVPALLLCLQVQFFEFVVGQCQEIAQFVGHGCRSFSFAVDVRDLGKTHCTGYWEVEMAGFNA